MYVHQDLELIGINKSNRQASDIFKKNDLVLYLFCKEESPNLKTLCKMLKHIYRKSQERIVKLEIICVPLDIEPKKKAKCLSFQGKWYAIPHDHICIGELVQRFGIIYHPNVVVLKTSTGKVISYNAEREIYEYGLDVLIIWS